MRVRRLRGRGKKENKRENERERKREKGERQKTKSTRVGGKFSWAKLGGMAKKMSSNFYECYLIEKRRLSLNRERRQDVYRGERKRKKKERKRKRK